MGADVVARGLQVLRMPLFQLPQLITQLVNAQVAMTRLTQFLAAEQKPPEQLLEPAGKGESTSPGGRALPCMRPTSLAALRRSVPVAHPHVLRFE